nr:MAG: hypothetical protein A2V48_00890 [Candidatus Amesbacteria bacterium RBG_19FT_COMBO_48_16]
MIEWTWRLVDGEIIIYVNYGDRSVAKFVEAFEEPRNLRLVEASRVDKTWGELQRLSPMYHQVLSMVLPQPPR